MIVTPRPSNFAGAQLKDAASLTTLPARDGRINAISKDDSWCAGHVVKAGGLKRKDLRIL